MAQPQKYPPIIQGGMGAGVSPWTLARSVSKAGQIGVVAGTALDLILARRLQMGDPEGHLRRALSHFPDPTMTQEILDNYFVDDGLGENEKFKNKPMVGMTPSDTLNRLLVISGFVEVFLAKEGHDGMVGINLLEKIQTPTLPILYGAMLADVDLVIMGAGIPKMMPGVIDNLSQNKVAEIKLHVTGATAEDNFTLRFDPQSFFNGPPPPISKPLFFPIVSSVTLATMLTTKSNGKIDGMIIEGATAGGHNSPPRGKLQLNEKGEPLYGKRDEVDLSAIKALGLPFYLAGSYGTPEALNAALATGASGVQVGTLFAYSEESGLDPSYRQQILELSQQGQAGVFTDPLASPTGFPFKVVQLDTTLSNKAVYEKRQRICDLGYLREAYRKDDGRLGWRCPSEPVKDFERKGGDLQKTEGRKCLCNGLMANIGLAQWRKDGSRELPLVTSGDDVAHVARLLDMGRDTYHATDVIEYLLSQQPALSDAF